MHKTPLLQLPSTNPYNNSKIVLANREEKSLCHIAMEAKFLDDNKSKPHLKSGFTLFHYCFLAVHHHCCKNSLLLWSRNFATMVTWCHTSPLYWFGQRGFGSGEGGLLGLLFAGYVLLASQNPYPVTVYSVTYYKLLAKCNFHHPNLVTSW